MKVETILEQMMFSTVRLTATEPNGAASSGTGFYFAINNPEANTSKIFLVTNKHVVKGAAHVVMHCIAANPDGSPALGVELAVDAGSATDFEGHPDPAVDIAVTAITGIRIDLERRRTPVFMSPAYNEICATNEILEADFEPVEPVTLIGYPNRLYDKASLLPIVRRGHAATALSVDFDNKPQFLIDASVFPGSSGSPVFIVVPEATPNKHGAISWGGGTRVLLLGILAKGHMRELDLVPAVPGARSREALDLGVVYKASAILESCEAFRRANK